ncbi:MAG: alkaline phosphatase family protein [Bacteroidia bacterium]
MKRKWIVNAGIGGALALMVAVLAACAGTSANGGSPKSKKPKLVVGIIVDQMRFDYLKRFWPNFGEGGFKRLVQEGSSFTSCNYNYVPTETAPGHASVFTGTTPSRHGIIMNNWYDPETIGTGKAKGHSSVFDTLYPYVGMHPLRTKGKGVSPRWLDATTIADQLKAATNGKAKCVGVSLKDRSAILPVGKSADAAYFFDAVTGSMVSSSYYPSMKSGLPKWADTLNARRFPIQMMSDPKGWELLLAPEKYLAEDGPSDAAFEGAYELGGSVQFPHHVPMDSLICCGEFATTAWGNNFLKDFAMLAVDRHGLGNDEVTDFLSLSFSSTDMVAHQFGPQSREVEDTYLRLDRDLASFLDFLDKRVGKDRVLVFLTADHGGAPNPQYAVDHGDKGGWLNTPGLREQLRLALGDQAGKDSLLFGVAGHHIYLNKLLAQRRGMDWDSLCEKVADVTGKFPGIIGAFPGKEILALSGDSPAATFLKNGYYPSRSGDVLFMYQFGFQQPPYDPKETFRHRKGTSHGSHFDYDTHVPLLFWGGGVPVQVSDVPVVIPDIAATVCRRLGISAPSKCSGHPIPGM